ncbi:MAG: hypothetical protein ACM3WU_09915 [Bacillota bacterium]
MKLLEVLSVLQLSPLIRRFREKVEKDELPLEESVKTLSHASELVLLKLRWLLPATRLPDEAPQEAEEIIPAGDELVAATAALVMEPWELAAAIGAVESCMRSAARMFAKGHTPTFEGGRQLVVGDIDPLDLRRSLLTAQRRTGSSAKVLVVPRFNFVTHLRDFWREVRRLTAKGAILRFSRFLGKTKQEAILNFLAFLELVKRRRLYARQKELFGDIEFGTTRETVDREGNSEP